MDDLTRLPGEAAPAGTLASSAAGCGHFAPGTVFAGRFRIVAPLGRGGMGGVYRADDLKLGQTVALKLLPDNVAHDPARLAQFHNEIHVSVPPDADVARPYAGASILLLFGIAALSLVGFHASRGAEPLFGRTLLD
jgi:hypothetical protein